MPWMQHAQPSVLPILFIGHSARLEAKQVAAIQGSGVSLAVLQVDPGLAGQFVRRQDHDGAVARLLSGFSR